MKSSIHLAPASEKRTFTWTDPVSLCVYVCVSVCTVHIQLSVSSSRCWQGAKAIHSLQLGEIAQLESALSFPTALIWTGKWQNGHQTNTPPPPPHCVLMRRWQLRRGHGYCFVGFNGAPCPYTFNNMLVYAHITSYLIPRGIRNLFIRQIFE